MNTIYVITWSGGRYDEHEEGVCGWCETEERARAYTDDLNAKMQALRDWYAKWYAENPAPRSGCGAYESWERVREAATHAYLDAHGIEGLRGDWDFNYGGVPGAANYSYEAVERIP